jgi:formate hydrogenlyase transcriptional activator
VRELQNVIERAIILSRGPRVDVDARVLPGPAMAGAPPPAAAPAPAAAGTPAPALPGDGAPRDAGVVRTLAETDRAAILAALDAAEWRISGRGGAAEALGLKPTTLHGKMRRLGIRRPRPSDLARELRRQ